MISQLLQSLLFAVAMDSGKAPATERATIPPSRGIHGYTFRPPANAAVACQACATRANDARR